LHPPHAWAHSWAHCKRTQGDLSAAKLR
jgi:hypothetical protein